MVRPSEPPQLLERSNESFSSLFKPFTGPGRIRTGNGGGAIVAHRSGTPFSKKRYRAIVDEIAAKVEAGRLAKERDAVRAANVARQAEDEAKADRAAGKLNGDILSAVEHCDAGDGQATRLGEHACGATTLNMH